MNNDLKMKIIKLRNRIKLGYGLTGKPISPKRLTQMKRKLFNMEYELAESQGNKYLETGNINVFKS